MTDRLRESLYRLRSFFSSAQDDYEFEAEMSAHLQFAAEENLQRGLPPAEARRQALIQFGGPQQAKEQHREARGLPFLDALLQDLRFGLRMLVKYPVFTAVAVLTLGLGIGATTAIFSVVDGVLLRSLPYRNADQIVRLWEQAADGHHISVADPNFEDLRSQNRTLQGVAEYGAGLQSVSGANEPTRTMVATVSRDFFSIMGVQPIFGREFAPEEQQYGVAAVAVVSDGYWKQSLGGTRDLSSVHLKLGSQPISIIGVLPPGFNFPDSAEIWIPREIFEKLPSRTAHNWNVIGRLRDGASVTAARSELSAIAERLKQQYGQDTMMAAVAVEPLREAMTGKVRPALLVLLGASGFLLLIACANVVNLMLAQAAGRERELSIRSALGAQRARLIRQFLTESFLLCAGGGAFGVLLAYWGLKGLLALAPANMPRLEEVSLNPYVLLFSLGMILLVALALGIFTALRSVSASDGRALEEGARGETGSLQKHRLGRLISAGQLATALALLVGASLLGRSLLQVLSIDSGFRTEQVVTMNLRLPDAPQKSQRIGFLNELLTRLRTVPNVEEVGGSSVLPFVGPNFPDGYYVVMNPAQISPHMQDLIQRSVDGNLEKDPALLAEFSQFFEVLFRDRERMGEADYAVASEGFFKALGIPLLQGRFFDDRDTLDAPPVALISQSLAAQKWPNQDPLGRTVEFGNMDGDPRLLTVIGVVGDVRDQSLEAPPNPTIYVNFRQRPQAAGSFTCFIRTFGNPDSVYGAARSIVSRLDPSLPVQFRTLSQVYSASLDARRFSLTLFSVFSLTALVLALAGIYGVTSYSVSQRTREIGVRMALGASTREVLRMVLKQGLITAVAGIAVGILGSVFLTRAIQSQLFGVNAMDLVTFVGVTALILLVSLVACWIPGRRAARVDPTVALR
ncbi:MAG TPA: ABC transporter permease, partial [Candidatus Angelobacter sp.]|nr:ABC transporter permease [Candidatus Angelobacter sp.]